MAHHEPFKALGPLPWEILLGGNDTDRQTALANLLKSTFSSAQVLIDSIPSDTNPLSSPAHHHHGKASAKKKPTTTRARSHTDSAVNPNQPNPFSILLQKEWKEIKTAPKDNPLGIQVHKLSARDGNGSWFARRSVHRGVPFAKWVLGLRREFAETSALRTGKTDSKSVRGLGAERRVERVIVEGVGTAEVYLVSVRFPGPTTPRDFVTVLLMPEGEGEGRKGERRFMLVSRPCEHKGCGARQGFIRGTYESVEMVREVKEGGRMGLRRTRSSDDLGGGVGDGEELRVAVARRVVEERGRHGEVLSNGEAKTASSSPGPREEEEEEAADVAVEWLMVTRSDPGGSVPRFMVEKGTPGGIINDAGRFLNWVTHKKEKALRASLDAGVDELDEQEGVTSPEEKNEIVLGQHDGIEGPARKATDESDETVTQDIAPPTGFYGMIASALEAAGSVVISRMSSLAGSAAGSTKTDSELDDDSDSESDASELSYASAEEGSLAQSALNDVKDSPSIPDLASSARSIQSTLSSSSHSTPAPADQKHDKELQRLQERRRRAHEKMTKMQEKVASKRKETDSGKDKEAQQAALAKLREKHERELAKQEEKFQRDVLRLQEKRARELRKAEERRQKAEEREERHNLHAELEKTRAERDVALREIEILKEQVGALQSQNTMLVARLGKEGSSVSLGRL
ncbi:reticulocyte-binding protein 2 a [Podospora aff. communis PSN243]|uniref:Reticulocyte-binding protein 2 a n=1 Tax=Podospora aff. communis PSN243 TaxID=3040156 RepID=A0AAV9H633_9PEZI|nr:reticulocyte-binding protein 2 a [Podospora aff. communis PSN243]